MSAALTHRGPDDTGVVVDTRVALANRRLSIVDIPGGHQPMTSPDGATIVTFNGEIYNAPELRARLERNGHVYRTHCDTEALLHLHAEHGADLVDALRGCYAFALWDRRTEELLLVRDRLGVKPLYFVHEPDGTLYFASEIKALVAAGVVRRELNVKALPGYLANRATYGEETLFAGVRRLLPGHVLSWRDGTIAVRRYWDLPAGGLGGLDDGRYVEEWTRLFRESVELRLMSDVPIGVLLSGGIDSSAIAAVMSTLRDEPVNTFSVGFAEAEASELPAADAVAHHLGSNHRRTVVTGEQFFSAIPTLTWHGDEPLGHSASVPLFFLAELAARDVKVVLTGEGADETLAGYARYRKTLYNLGAGSVYERLTTNSGRRRIAARIHGRRLGRTFLARPADERHLYLDNFAVFDTDGQRDLLTAETRERAGRDPHHDALVHFSARSGSTLLERMLYSDCKTYLQGLLMKQDKMSMAASVEGRVPFLDHELVEFTTRLPSRLKLRRGWETKPVLRRSMADVLPRSVISRPKRGFPVPVDSWLRGPWHSVLDEYVLGERAQRRGLFERDSVGRLVQEYRAGAPHGERIWSLVSFEHWARCFLDGESPPQTAADLASRMP